MMPELLQTTLSLVLVLGLVAASAWLLARWYKPRGGPQAMIKVQAMVSLGVRERAVLLEVGGRWLLVGVAPGRVNTLLELPGPPPAPEEDAAPTTSPASWLQTHLNKFHVR